MIINDYLWNVYVICLIKVLNVSSDERILYLLIQSCLFAEQLKNTFDYLVRRIILLKQNQSSHHLHLRQGRCLLQIET